MKRLLLLLTLTLCAGCNSLGNSLGNSLAIPLEFRPLERIQERPNVVVSDSAITTIGKTVYVANLRKFNVSHPFMGPRYQSLMLHERQHSIRQDNRGVVSWTARYLTETEFMYKEEQIGWYYEIITLRRLGQQVSPVGVAMALSNYKNLRGRMVSFAEALTWVRAVLNGTWTPTS